MSQPQISAIYPTTPAQQGFVLGSISQPEASIFVEQAVFPLTGSLDVERLTRVWQELGQRHDILRTAFAWDLSDHPRQVVLSHAELVPEIVDARGQSAEEQDLGVRSILKRHRAVAFDLKRPPLLRLTVQLRAEQEHSLVWTHHHAILDGWSQMILLGEMLRAYDARDQATATPPPFGKYARWITRRNLTPHQSFWIAAFQGYSPPEPIPAAPLPNGSDRFGTHVIALMRDELDALERLARDNDLTVSSVILGVWSLIAARLRGAGQIVVGVTTSGRSPQFPAASEMIGPFANTIPLRMTIEDDQDFGSWALQLQARLAEATQFGDCSAGQVHRWAALPADRPLFDSIFAMANYPPAMLGGTDPGRLRVRADAVEAYGGRTLQPLTLVATTGAGLTLRLVNDRWRIPDAVAVAALGAHRAALTNLVARGMPTRVGDLLEGTPAPGRLECGHDVSSGVLPESGTAEAVVAQMFARVLNQESVAVDANFLALGGHSIVAIELLATLRGAFGVDLTLQDLVAYPTPAGIARKVNELLGAGGPAPESLPQITHDAQACGQPFPLSEIQAAYWVGRQPGFELSGVDSHIYAEIDVPDLDIARLEAAWITLVSRHPMLRTVFMPDGRQVTLEDVPPYTIAVTDATRNDGGEALATTRERLARARRSASEWPLFTIEAATLADGVARLFLSFDLLIGDAQSWRILYHELRRLYRDPGDALPPLDITFQDYVSALPSLRETAAYRRARDYWRSRLHRLPPPPVFPRPPLPSDLDDVRFVRQQQTLSPTESRQMRRRATELGVTTSTLLLAIFSEVLGRYTNAGEFLINLTIFNRLPLHPQVDRLVGDFTSLSLASICVRGESFGDRIRRLQRQLWVDLDHRLYSGVEVLRDIGEHRGTPRAALAPVVFTSTLDLGKVADASGEPFPGTVVYSIGQTPQVTFDYQTYETNGEIVINWDTVSGLFPDGYLDEMFRAHADTLRLIIDGAGVNGQYAPGLAPAPAAESPAPLGETRLLHDPFIAQAHQHPERIAIVSHNRRLTYQETLDRAMTVAENIAAASSSDRLVGILMEKGWEQVVGTLGALLAGRPFVPLDASWPATRVASLVERTGADVVLTQRRVLQRLNLPANLQCVVVDEATPEGAGRQRLPHNATTADALAYVIFTSGSTGAPKGVMIQHRAALNTVLDVNRRFGITARDKVLAISPLAFDLSIYDLFGILAAGGTIVIPKEAERRDPASWARLISAEQITLWNSVPVLMDLLTKAVESGGEHRLRSLRLCLLSGDWIPLTLPDAIRKHAPGAKVISLGGATEGSIWSILYEVEKIDPAWSSVPYGYSMTGQSVEVLGEDFTPCPVWVPGEIYIGGHGVSLGYWGAPELTATSFVPDPRTGGRLYRTGDWGRLRPDGAIEFLGRQDNQVKVNGYRVELSEIETALAAARGVERAVVVATGERTDRRLAAFVTGKTRSAELREELSTKVPGYMVPASIQVLEQLPLSSTGKVDRAELVRLAQAAPQHQPAASDGAAIRSELQATVTSVLTAEPHPDANLLSLGLTSIDVIRLMNAIEQRVGRRPNIEEFYRRPTLRGLNQALDSTPAQSIAPQPFGDVPRATTPWDGWPLLKDPAEREAFRAERPRFMMAPATRLLPPEAPMAAQHYARHRVTRDFSDAAVPLSLMSRMLNPLRRVIVDGRQHFLYPSAGGLYGVNIYIHARPGRVEGLSEGLYYYHPDAHDLIPCVTRIELDTSLHAGIVNAPIARTAAFTVFFITDPAQSAPLYGAEAERLCLLNAGYLGQLLCDGATDVGVGICPLHGYHFERLRWMFPHGDRAVLLHLLAGGLPKVERPGGQPGPQDVAPPTTRAKTVMRRETSRGTARVTRTAPLSPGQERLLQAEYARPDGSWPEESERSRLRPVDTGGVLIEGDLDVDALRRAVNTLIERQAALRTTFRFPPNAAPVQIVTTPQERQIEFAELCGEPEPAALMQLVADHSEREISPTDPDLFHIKLVHLGEAKHLLLIQIHHLISDGWSLGVLYRELSETYNAYMERREIRLPPLPQDFSEVCVRMSEERKGERLAAQCRYWREALAAPPAGLNFFGKVPKPYRGTTPVSDAPVHIPDTLVAELRAASRRAPTPGGLAGPILAALAIVLHAQTGATQIDIGCMIANRTNHDTEHLIGNFLNTVIIRLVIDGEVTLSQFLSQANQRVVAAMENQNIPVQDVLAQLGGQPDAHKVGAPHRVTLALNNMRRESLTLTGSTCTDVFRTADGELVGPRDAPTTMAQRWILEERADGLRGSVTYNTDLFDARALHACLCDLQTTLTAFTGGDPTVKTVTSLLDSASPALRSWPKAPQ